MPELLDVCHAKNITVSMDCQHKEDTLDMPLVREIISKLDIFIPNAIEAQRLTGTQSVDEAAAVLCEIVPYLVIKDGANGAYAWRDGQRYQATAIPVTSIVETTGAGDVFNAGFLAAYFAGKSPQECLQWGNIAGGLSLRGHGGYATSPTLDELLQHIR
jgi:sugar/nucleoside kinase (ribokinase family)